MSKLLSSGEPHSLDLPPRGHTSTSVSKRSYISLKEELNYVFSFSKDEMRRDSLECAGLELKVWRQKILLITDQIIYEVWDCILQEPVVRHAALILEKCLLRASSLGDKQREIPRKKEHELNRGTKRQTEAVWGHEHPGSRDVLVHL